MDGGKIAKAVLAALTAALVSWGGQAYVSSERKEAETTAVTIMSFQLIRMEERVRSLETKLGAQVEYGPQPLPLGTPAKCARQCVGAVHFEDCCLAVLRN